MLYLIFFNELDIKTNLGESLSKSGRERQHPPSSVPRNQIPASVVALARIVSLP